MSFLKATQALQKAVNQIFGVSVTYTSSIDGSVTEIKGIFDNAFIEIQDFSTKKPILRINLSDLEKEPAEGDLVEIESKNYSVLDSQPDSHGSTTLILQKVQT